METPIRNVRQTYDSGKLWLFDNEFSSFEGFKNLYSDVNSDDEKEEYTEWFWLQESILRSICVFRKQTIQNIEALAEQPLPDQFLLRYVQNKESYFHAIDDIGELSPGTKYLFAKRFRERLKLLMSWIQYCKEL